MDFRKRVKRDIKKKTKKALKKLGFYRPVLSIVVPLYNCEEYIAECLQSIAHSIKNINAEVIVVDDASDDNSAKIAKAFIKKNRKFRYYLIERSGISDARNYGIKKASGKYLGFVDADDIVREDMYTQLLEAAEKNRADVAIIDAERFNSKGTWGSILHRKTFDGLEKDVIHIKNYPKLVYDSTAWNKIIRRKLWIKKGLSFPSGRLYEDVAVSLPLHYEANRVAVVRKIGYEWRNRESSNRSITQMTERMVNLQDRLYALDLLFDYVQRRMKNEKDIIRELKNKFLTIDIRMFVDKSFSLKGDHADQYRKEIRDFLNRHFTEEDYRELDEQNKETYKKFFNSVNADGSMAEI